MCPTLDFGALMDGSLRVLDIRNDVKKKTRPKASGATPREQEKLDAVARSRASKRTGTPASRGLIASRCATHLLQSSSSVSNQRSSCRRPPRPPRPVSPHTVHPTLTSHYCPKHSAPLRPIALALSLPSCSKGSYPPNGPPPSISRWSPL